MAQGAFVIIQNDGRDILLVKRKDIPLWDLPGGRIAEGETPESAAVSDIEKKDSFIANENIGGRRCGCCGFICGGGF